LGSLLLRCSPLPGARRSRSKPKRAGEERKKEGGYERMPTTTCNACNVVFFDDEQKRIHYRSEWHRFNLKRKVSNIYRSSPPPPWPSSRGNSNNYLLKGKKNS
jgi:hypothetical protein